MPRLLLLALAVLFGLYAAPAPAQTHYACENPGYLAHFDDRLGPQSCDTIATATVHWRGGTAQIRAIRPHDTPIGDSAGYVRMINDVATRVGAAMDQMGGPLELDTVTIVFTNYVSPRESGTDWVMNKGAYTAGASRTFAHECPVSYYKERVPHGYDNAVFTLSHELFHCIQYRTWPGMPDQGWLVEATAEYFAYLAKPDFGVGFIPQFDQNIRDTGIDQMSYPDVVFYLWLGDAYGPSRVRELIAASRGIEGSITPDMMGEFAKAYYDRRIHIPGGGRVIPSNPQLDPAEAVHGNGVFPNPDMVPYSLGNRSYTFDRDRRFALNEPPLPAHTRNFWRKQPGGAWGPALTQVATCDGPQSYLAVWGTTAAASLGSLRVTATPAGTSTCTCPAGRWQETADSVHQYFEQSAMGGEPPRVVSGRRTLTLNPDHTGSLSYDAVVTETRDNPSFWLRQTKTGTMTFTWKVVGNKLLTQLTPGGGMIQLHNETHSPSGVRVEDRRAMGQTIGHEYLCNESGLHLKQLPFPVGMPVLPGMGDLPVRQVGMDFTRAGP